MLSLNKALNKKYPRGKHRYKSMTRAYLQTFESWKIWNDSKESTMLVLSGTTTPKARTQPSTRHSWLSPAAIYTVEDIRQNGGYVAFYCCHTISHANQDEDHYFREVIAGLVYQILYQNPRILKEKGAQLQSLLSRPQWLVNGATVDDSTYAVAGEKIAVNVWLEPLEEVLVEASKDAVVHIVLDRIELARGCALKRIMTGLSDLVHKPEVLVKMFIIIDAAGAKWDASEVALDSEVMILEDLDQRT
jgi:hypothetical protein